MPNAIDVADYILQARGPMSVMKLQKLVYYAQAWHLVWKDEPLFAERIEAWANGPVVPDLYNLHRGNFKLEAGHFRGEVRNISADSRDVIDRILKYYGDKDSQWLSELTHLEAPWKSARNGIADGERGNTVIAHDVMAEYYASL
jgi:uncharacterized phage-associated protein